MSSENESYKAVEHKMILSNLIVSNLPVQKNALPELQQKTVAIVGAAIETTNSTFSVTSFHVLEKPDIRRRLKKDLETTSPDVTKPPSLTELERLPYLSGIVLEG